MNRRWVPLLISLILLGLIAIWLGWRWSSEGYVSSLALEVGAGLLLFACLLPLERTLSRRIEGVRDEVKEEGKVVADRIDEIEETVAEVQESVSARLDEVDQLTKAALEARLAPFSNALEVFNNNVSAEALSMLLTETEKWEAIDPRRLRSTISPQSKLRLAARRQTEDATPFAIRLAVENVQGEQLAATVWTDEPVEVIMGGLVDLLAERGEFSPTGFDATKLLKRIANSLTIAVLAKSPTGPGRTTLAPVIEVVTNDWALTTRGLEHITLPLAIPWEDLDADSETYWYVHASGDTGRDEFRRIFRLALAMKGS